MSKEYYVYIMTNKSRTLYTGVTNDLMRRVYEHKNKFVKGFTGKYNIQFLVYYESTSDIHSAIAREKQLKGWLRSKKIDLIDSTNPEWKDLSEEWFDTKRTKEPVSENSEEQQELP
jgi:putative endonuclease